MRTAPVVIAFVATLVAPLFRTVAAEYPARQAEAPNKVRIGVFDSRAVAIAYAPCEIHNNYMRDLKARHEKAQESGDEKKVKQIEREAEAQQALLHRQGFSTGSVGNIMKHVKTRMATVAQEANVDVIVSKWETVYAGRNIELVDVTPQIVELFDPSERTLKIVEQLKDHEPVPIEKFMGHECK